MSRTPYQNNKVDEVSKKVEDVKGIMQKNIELTLDRGERLEHMEDKAANLEDQSRKFHQNAVKVKRYFCCQYVKQTILLFLVIAIIAVIIGVSVWQSQK